MKGNISRGWKVSSLAGAIQVYTPDSHKTNDNSLIKKHLIKVHCETTSVNFLLIQLAHLFKSKFEVEATIEEQIKDKSKKIIITRVDYEKILSETQLHINDIKENLPLEF